jgi:uncharacterized membrane protein required for colicin V production
MYLDIGIAVFVGVFALLGLIFGFWGQFLRILALVSLIWVAPPVAELAEPYVADVMSSGATPKAVEATSLIAAAVILYLAMSLVIFAILRAIFKGRKKSPTNRVMGLVLGAVKSGALCYILLNGLVLLLGSPDYRTALAELEQSGELSADSREALGKFMEEVATSKSVELVEDYNLLEAMGYEPPSYDEVQREADEILGDDQGVVPSAPEGLDGSTLPPGTQLPPGTELPPGIQLRPGTLAPTGTAPAPGPAPQQPDTTPPPLPPPPQGQ